MSPTRVLLPVDRTRTVRRAVGAAVERALAEDDHAVIRAVYLPRYRSRFRSREAELDAGRELLDRVELWLREDAEGVDGTIEVETAVLERDVLPYTPPEIADAFLEEIDRHDIDLIIFDPSYDPGIQTGLLAPVERILRSERDVVVEEVAVSTRVRRPRLPRSADVRRYAAIFALTFAFYLVLAGTTSAFDLVTGVVTAGIVTLTLGGIALWQPPAVTYTPVRVLRGFLYVPYLLIMIIQANVEVARVILHPRLPIEPRVVRFRPAVFGPFPLTTLANSITLTPGTLSMRVVGQEILVHTLLPESRDDLVGGRLERAVRFLFYGRRGMRVASPEEREDARILEPDDPKP